MSSSQSPDGCPICFDDLEGALGACVPCGHVFHSHCFEQWKESCRKSRPKCPVCQQRAMTFTRLYCALPVAPVCKGEDPAVHLEYKLLYRKAQHENREWEQKYQNAVAQGEATWTTELQTRQALEQARQEQGLVILLLHQQMLQQKAEFDRQTATQTFQLQQALQVAIRQAEELQKAQTDYQQHNQRVSFLQHDLQKTAAAHKAIIEKLQFDFETKQARDLQKIRHLQKTLLRLESTTKFSLESRAQFTAAVEEIEHDWGQCVAGQKKLT